jgi:rubrerythrin
MDEKLKDIKTLALQMEMDGIKFYNDLAARTLHPMGRAMFKSFVEDEKSHARRIRNLLPASEEHGQPEGGVDENPRERLLTVFRQLDKKTKEKVVADTNDIEAVKLAIGIEEKGMGFYDQAAREAVNARERETFRFLAEEEKIHFTILKNTLTYLENAELWEAEKEGRIYDMWMNMIKEKYA